MYYFPTTVPYKEPLGRIFIIMNYGVHSVMYPYFALKVQIIFQTDNNILSLYNKAMKLDLNLLFNLL